MKERLNKFTFIVDGGKKRFNIQKIGGIMAFVLCSLYGIFTFLFDPPPIGISKKSERNIIPESEKEIRLEVAVQETPTFQAQDPPSKPLPSTKHRDFQYSGQSKIVFRAKQVLERSDSKDVKRILPAGSNLIGKLLTAIDSRDLSSPVKVLLPYGGKFQHEELIEKNTILIGRASISGKGDRIFITLDRAVSQSGQERSIVASALDSSDYFNGVIGDVHSEIAMRAAGTLGLTMVASMSDVLTSKTAYGESGVVLAKANMRNATLQGVSKASEMAASRQVEFMEQAQPYITVDAGTDLIITLGGSYGAENEKP